jgi:P-type Mg2+ transporter
LATQALVIFAIRTRRVPFLRSRPSMPLLAAALAVVAVGSALPLSPLSGVVGFRALPIGFFGTLGGLVVIYLILIELAKRLFFAERPVLPVRRLRGAGHWVHRRASRFTHAGPLS